VLRALPEWFGIEAAIVDYVNAVRGLTTYAAFRGDEAIALLAVKVHNPRAAEVYVMGVLPEHHGHGVGSALLAGAEDALRERRIEYMQVKTLGPSRESRGYEATRRFYEARGFVPLEEFADLWPGNPCLLLVKHLQ
jgi:GNAT superfamily N-acetyltransferase